MEKETPSTARRSPYRLRSPEQQSIGSRRRLGEQKRVRGGSDPEDLGPVVSSHEAGLDRCVEAVLEPLQVLGLPARIQMGQRRLVERGGPAEEKREGFAALPETRQDRDRHVDPGRADAAEHVAVLVLVKVRIGVVDLEARS